MDKNVTEGDMSQGGVRSTKMYTVVVATIMLLAFGAGAAMWLAPDQQKQQQSLPSAISAEAARQEMLAVPQEVTTYEAVSLVGVIEEVKLNNGALGNGSMQVVLEGHEQPVLVMVSPYVTLEGVTVGEIVAGGAVRLKKAYDLRDGTYLVEVISK